MARHRYALCKTKPFLPCRRANQVHLIVGKNNLTTLSNLHKVDEAAKVVAEDYIQHNPTVPDGKEPFVSYYRDFFKKTPGSRARIIRSAVEGDIVWLHVHSVNDEKDRGEAVLDVFRVKDGKIVEHWDVIQAVPETAENSNTMF